MKIELMLALVVSMFFGVFCFIILKKEFLKEAYKIFKDEVPKYAYKILYVVFILLLIFLIVIQILNYMNINIFK